MSRDVERRVGLEFADGAAIITLLRAGRMNAIDEPTHVALRSAIEAAVEEKGTRAIILTGSGRGFCSGQDLNERAAIFEAGGSPDLRRSLDEFYNPLIRSIVSLPVPVIAAINGIAFGAGAALAIACDIVLAAQSARFQFGFVNVGLGPDSGASWFLPRLAGHAVALDLALTGRAISAGEAHAAGLVSRVVADEDLPAVARQLAREIAESAPAAVTAIKCQMRGNLSLSLEEALASERDMQAVLGRSATYRSAVLRFAERAR